MKECGNEREQMSCLIDLYRQHCPKEIYISNNKRANTRIQCYRLNIAYEGRHLVNAMTIIIVGLVGLIKPHMLLFFSLYLLLLLLLGILNCFLFEQDFDIAIEGMRLVRRWLNGPCCEYSSAR